jgi:phosphatidylserine decarboxylase
MARGGWECLGGALAGTGAFFAGFCCFFFRDPERPLPGDASKIYATGDGRVLSVGAEGAAGAGQTVRIFLSLFDVHVQRLPVSGKVKEMRHEAGRFALAMKPEACRNERTVVRVAVEGRSEELAFEQIAGFLARRIVCDLKAGDAAVAGERYGVIHFGSQAAIHLPPTAKPLVKPGDRVTAGVTPIGEWTKPA